MQIHCIVYLSLWPSSHEIWACRDINVAKTHWCNLTASQSKICRKFLGRCLIVLNDLRSICWDIEDKINFYCSFLYVTSNGQIFWQNYYCLLNFKVYYMCKCSLFLSAGMASGSHGLWTFCRVCFWHYA